MSLDSPGCIYTGTVHHEFLHALGLEHEQSRHDRDTYVNTHIENVESGTNPLCVIFCGFPKF